MTDEGHRVRDGRAMLAGMAPVLRQGSYAFATLAPGAAPPAEALGTFREDEGLSAITPCAPDAPLAMACITLTVPSALDGVGLTAAVSGALAQNGIPCNVVAAHFHDHLFVPVAQAERALSILRKLAEDAGQG